jgi:hypothetical protein
VSVHHKGRICLLDDYDFEKLSCGIKLNCKEHKHVGRVQAFELTREPRFGKLLAFLASSASTRENPAPAGCFVEIGGLVEYVHLRKSSKPNLKSVYALGERIGKEQNKPFKRRSYY